jgi:hypothetical protein
LAGPFDLKQEIQGVLVLLQSLFGRHFKRSLDEGHIETIIAGGPPRRSRFKRADIAPVEAIDDRVVEHSPTIFVR